MRNIKSSKSKKIIIWTTVVALLFLVTFGGFVIYTSSYYRADNTAISAFISDLDVQKMDIGDGVSVYGSTDADYGLIFYPGGKVEHTAYEPLLYDLASRGVLCVLIKMPFNLAVLNMNAADGICEIYPDIEHWYIGGHSLGGAMASYYANSNNDTFDGLLLLGAYSSVDLSETALRVLSIFGSEDKIIDMEKYLECKANLPYGFSEIKIDGGCHAYFGMYGSQKGDGAPTITVEDQIHITSDCIFDFIKGGE